MRPFTQAQLATLATAYIAATGCNVSYVSGQAAGNVKTIGRLLDGAGMTLATAERMSVWFAENWPEGVAWPRGVPAPRETAQ